MKYSDGDIVSLEGKTEFLLGETQLFDKLVWMTSEEAARYLRKSIGALRTAVCRGQIRARKWRRRLYFRRTELDRMLELSE
ncbi:MAG: helix-turn-helix domain-containing protein [Bdellovibrionales bacterium]|nr:helix-turn-helix domain-containing protein [Bdellovibrionales bacterium]